ncbi:hypothetical protein [Nonomuraea sp. NPDC049625]|uniref:hypothetical protein n=1 Tax=Nonomuraea sp. NPDC049625 TaxID=3155775 RepID=UPI003440FF10
MTADDLVVLDGDHRRAAGLPTSFTVLDRRMALLAAERDDPEGGHLEIWSRPLVAGLIALFDRHWSAAPPPALSRHEREG